MDVVEFIQDHIDGCSHHFWKHVQPGGRSPYHVKRCLAHAQEALKIIYALNHMPVFNPDQWNWDKVDYETLFGAYGFLVQGEPLDCESHPADECLKLSA